MLLTICWIIKSSYVFDDEEMMMLLMLFVEMNDEFVGSLIFWIFSIIGGSGEVVIPNFTDGSGWGSPMYVNFVRPELLAHPP